MLDVLKLLSNGLNFLQMYGTTNNDSTWPVRERENVKKNKESFALCGEFNIS
jgi:hypothetical protein